MKPTESTKGAYLCEYPSTADMLPVGTVRVLEYSETGILEAYISANAQLDVANLKLMGLGEFVRRAKAAEAAYHKD